MLLGQEQIRIGNKKLELEAAAEQNVPF